MIDSERFKLLYGPYMPPKCRVGDKLPCEYRGREVPVGGMTDAPIQWPYARGTGRPGPIVCGSLIRAVQRESGIAVACHWGVSTTTVKKWRRALEVPATNNGTRRLHIAYAYEKLQSPENMAKSKEAMHSTEVRAKLRALRLGRPLHPKTAAALREAAQRPKSEEWKRGQSERSRKIWEKPEDYGLPSQHHWTDEEVALLGILSDSAVAAAMGLPVHVIVHKRRSLGIPTTVLQPWTVEEISLLGTDTDREVARRLGRFPSSRQCRTKATWASPRRTRSGSIRASLPATGPARSSASPPVQKTEGMPLMSSA